MGSTSGDSNETPVHTVTLTRVYSMSTYEITNEQAAAVFNEALSQGWVTASSSTVRNAQGDQQELLGLDENWSELSYTGGSLGVDGGKGDHPGQRTPKNYQNR